MQKEVLKEYLFNHCRGKERASSSRELARILRVSEKELGRQVNRLRREGIPIASIGRGYFLAQTAGDIYTTIQNLKKMRAGLDADISGLERSLDGFGAGGGTRHA